MWFSFILFCVLKLFHTKFTKTIILVGPLSGPHTRQAQLEAVATRLVARAADSAPFQLACCSGVQRHLQSLRTQQVQRHPSCPCPAPREMWKWAECSQTLPTSAHREKWAQVPAAGLQHPCSCESEKQPGGPLPPGRPADLRSAKSKSFGVGETQVQIQPYHETIP